MHKSVRASCAALVSTPKKLTSIPEQTHRNAVNEHGIALFGHEDIVVLAHKRGKPEAVRRYQRNKTGSMPRKNCGPAQVASRSNHRFIRSRVHKIRIGTLLEIHSFACRPKKRGCRRRVRARFSVSISGEDMQMYGALERLVSRTGFQPVKRPMPELATIALEGVRDRRGPVLTLGDGLPLHLEIDIRVAMILVCLTGDCTYQRVRIG